MMAATLTKLKDYWMDGHATPDDAKWRRLAQWVKINKNIAPKLKNLTVNCVK